MRLTAEQEITLRQMADAGKLTADNVVAEAKKKKSPLHGLIDWDDRTAAHKWRVQQARTVIAAARVVIRRRKTSVECAAYVRDPRCDPGEQGYVDVGSTLMSEHDTAVAAIEYEATRAAAYLARLRALAVVLDLEPQVDEILVKLSTFQEYIVKTKAAA